jgi:hypothetical protein
MEKVQRCTNCEGRIDRPGLMGCQDDPHPAPTISQRIVAAIEFDLTDRRGLKAEWAKIDEDTRDEIRDEWAKVVRSALRGSIT